MKTKNLKPFDLEAAKAGTPVMTRDGRPVRILCTDFKNDGYPVVAAILEGGEELLCSYNEQGRLCMKSVGGCDLFMAPIKRTGWVNICHDKFGDSRGCFLYKTKEEAEEHARHREDYITTVPVEWEE